LKTNGDCFVILLADIKLYILITTIAAYIELTLSHFTPKFSDNKNNTVYN